MISEITYILDTSEDFLAGKKDRVQLALCNLLAGGHTLIEDLPGVGKTTLVKFFAQVFELNMSRIQFTNDMLPGDILGANVFSKASDTFQFHPGPIFGEIILADELNRAAPKTQSALLQAMEEKRVTVDGKSKDLGEVFHVIGTQNPRAQIGTFELPESQLDRFALKIDIGYPGEEETIRLLAQKSSNSYGQNLKRIPKEWILNSQKQVENIETSDAILSYVYRLLNASRNGSASTLPLSNRCGIDLVKNSKAWAWMNERDHVLPEDIQKVFPFVTGHRLSHPSNSSIELERELALELLESVNVRQ